MILRDGRLTVGQTRIALVRDDTSLKGLGHTYLCIMYVDRVCSQFIYLSRVLIHLMAKYQLPENESGEETFDFDDLDEEDSDVEPVNEDHDQGEDIDDSDDATRNAHDEFDDPTFWPPEAVAVLQEHKEAWVGGDRTQERVELAVNALVEIGQGKRPNIRKAVRKWLQRRSGKFAKYGPMHKPTLRSVMNFYEAERISREVEEAFKADPRLGKRDRIGIHAKALSKVIQEIICEPDGRRLKEMEERRESWGKRGPPQDVRRQ